MYFSQPGCGVRDHTPDCLCDVHVVEPVEIMDGWENDSFMIRPLLERIGASAWTRNGLLDLLTKQLDLHDDLVAYNLLAEHNSRTRAEGNNLLTRGQRRAIQQMSEARIKNSVIRSHMSERYGVDMTAAQVGKVVNDHRKRFRK